MTKKRTVIPLDFKLFASSLVRIPSLYVTIINNTGPNLPRLYGAVVVPMTSSGHLPCNFLVVHSLLTVQNAFRVDNIVTGDI